MAESTPSINGLVATFKTGKLSLKDIEAIFAALPLEIDFIDKNDKFAWFSNQPNRKYPRSVKDLGKSVDTCLPKMMVGKISSIIYDLKSNEKDSAELLINSNGTRALLSFYALRNEKNEYQGTIEVTQDVEHLANLLIDGKWLTPDEAFLANNQKVDTPYNKDHPYVAPKYDKPDHPKQKPVSHNYEKPDTLTGASDDHWLS